MRSPQKPTRLLSAVAVFVSSICSGFPQTLGGHHLAAEVREYVKYDSPILALSHVSVIDGTGAATRSDQTIIIRDGRIASIGTSSTQLIPAGGQVVDLSGYTVFPGLVGMHDHMYYPQPVNLLGQRVRGVTSLRTTASVEPYADLNLKNWIDAGKIPGPKIHVTGPYLEGVGNFRLPVHELSGPEDARKTVEFWADQGVTSFKAFMHITREELTAVIATAHKHGLKVTGHLCSITYREAAELGIDDIEHGFVLATDFNPEKQAFAQQTAPHENSNEVKMSAAEQAVWEKEEVYWRIPTNGLGNQVALLTGCENFGLYYIAQPLPTTASCTVMTRVDWL